MKLPMMPRQLLCKRRNWPGGSGGEGDRRFVRVPLNFHPLTLNAANDVSLYLALDPVPVTRLKTGNRAVTSFPAVMSAAHFWRAGRKMPG